MLEPHLQPGERLGQTVLVGFRELSTDACILKDKFTYNGKLVGIPR